MFEVENLTKKYDGFTLDGVSFKIKRGYITGFIGANGAGKSTTLRSMLGVIKPDSGKVRAFGLDFEKNEQEIKNRIAFSSGAFDYYSHERADRVAKYYGNFFANWDNEKYEHYKKVFSLDGKKKVRDFSAGMKVKFSLALALSHGAELFVFDEPTSGLDPIARDEMLTIFQDIVADGQKSVLYSTHITSDLDKCADYILFIHEGKIILDGTKEDIISEHIIVHGEKEQVATVKEKAIGIKENAYSFSALMKKSDANSLSLTQEIPNLEDIMVYYSKGGKR